MSLSHTVLLLDGEAPSQALLGSLLSEDAFFIVTDGAANTALSLQAFPSVIIGDMDSLDPLTSAALPDAAIITIADQSSNDFEKALLYLIEQGRTAELIILGLHGKRTDHFLTNLSVLVRLRDSFGTIRIIDASQEHRLLTEQHPSVKLTCPIGAAVSILPLPGSSSVRTIGLLYPLENEALLFGKREGLSNVVISEHGFTVEITDGAVLVSFPYQR